MKITRIACWALDLPFRDGAYRCRNRTETHFPATIVALRTDSGLTGFGEIAPLGAFYSEHFAEGARAGIRLLAPELIGLDPRRTGPIRRLLDGAMAGQADAKTPLDMALWDLAGQAAGMPLCDLLGGREGTDMALYRSVSQDAPEAMRAKAGALVGAGYRRLQVKVGADPDADADLLAAVADAVPRGVVLYADANGAWSTADALRFVAATRGIAHTLEQPCRSWEENAVVRRKCDWPFVLDESIDSLAALLRVRAEGAADGVTLKVARFGGIGATRLARDIAVEAGLMVTIEDIGGSEIATAAMAHLMASTPEAQRVHTCDFHNWVTVSTASGFPEAAPGRMRAPEGPGLGVTVVRDRLGPPLFTLGQAPAT